MTSVNQNFKIYAGDTAQVNIGVTQSDVAASLSNASVVWIVEESPKSGSLVRLTTDNGISVSGSIITLSISPSNTSSLTGNYYHEVEVVDVSGNISTVTTGTVTVKRSGAGY